MNRRLALITTQCFPPRIGGVETMMVELARALARAGWTVEVFADAPGRAEQLGDRVSVRRFWGPKPVRRWLKARSVASRLGTPPLADVAEPRSEGAALLVIADSWKSLEPLDADVLGRSKARVLCLAHGMEIPEAPAERKAQRMRAAFAKATSVVANSRFTARRAEPHVPHGKLTVVAPGVAPPSMASHDGRSALRARVGAGRPLLATLARLEPRKGVDMTIRAVAALKAAHPDIVFAVAGDGPDAPRLRQLAIDLDLDRNVLFLGRVDDVEKAALLEEADVFCMPARAEGGSVEGFGLSVVEAAWFGTPAIGGAGTGMSDAIGHEETGLLCDGSELASVVDALRRVLDDPVLRNSLGETARRRAQSQGWDEVLPRYLATVGL